MDDDDGIALVLARASELRSKVTNCIHNEEEDEEPESLVNIRDSLVALEAQLSSLQELQQQQWYEKEASLAEIDYSRKKLLQKLKTYKGEDLEVIHEAIAFASSTVDTENNDLLLPPYPTLASSSLASDSGYLSHFSLTTKISQNNHSTIRPIGTVNQSKPTSSLKGLRHIIGAAAKTVFTIVGFITVLHLSGFEPSLSKKRTEFKVLDMAQKQGNEEKRETVVKCPPGKVLVVENGVTRCLVKERVEVPFKSVATIPDVSYGCG